MRRIKATFPTPFHDMMQRLYRPIKRVQERLKMLMQRFHGEKYLSLHARGFYDNEAESTRSLLECSKQLLADGNVSYIFFATESQKLRKQALDSVDLRKVIVPKKGFVSDLAHHSDSISIRDSREEVEEALVEWLAIGKADLCMSSTLKMSTFSQTSLMAGKCTYIQFDTSSFQRRSVELKLISRFAGKTHLPFSHSSPAGYCSHPMNVFSLPEKEESISAQNLNMHTEIHDRPLYPLSKKERIRLLQEFMNSGSRRVVNSLCIFIVYYLHTHSFYLYV